MTPKKASTITVRLEGADERRKFVAGSVLADLLPKLETCMDEGQQEEFSLLTRANALSGQMLVGGVLISPDSAEARLCEIVERLADVEWPHLEDELTIELQDEVTDAMLERTRWGYCLGLVVGLRLAAAVGGAR